MKGNSGFAMHPAYLPNYNVDVFVSSHINWECLNVGQAWVNIQLQTMLRAQFVYC